MGPDSEYGSGSGSTDLIESGSATLLSPRELTLQILSTPKIILWPHIHGYRYFIIFITFIYFLGGLKCVGHSCAYVAHFVFSRYVWIRTLRAAVASRRAANLATHLPLLATHLPFLATHLPPLSHPAPLLATHLLHSFVQYTFHPHYSLFQLSFFTFFLCQSFFLILKHSSVADPGSRIQKQQQKTGVKKIFLSNHFL